MKPVDTVQTGQIIAGKYRVERVLGRGGMGVVLLAMHDALDQRVAIKIMHPEAAAEQEWVARFQREARMAAKIKTSSTRRSDSRSKRRRATYSRSPRRSRRHTRSASCTAI